jgi:hypothetical protein
MQATSHHCLCRPTLPRNGNASNLTINCPKQKSSFDSILDENKNFRVKIRNKATNRVHTAMQAVVGIKRGSK